MLNILNKTYDLWSHLSIVNLLLSIFLILFIIAFYIVLYNVFGKKYDTYSVTELNVPQYLSRVIRRNGLIKIAIFIIFGFLLAFIAFPTLETIVENSVLSEYTEAFKIVIGLAVIALIIGLHFLIYQNFEKNKSEDGEVILTPFQLIIKNFRKNKIAMTGFYIICFMLIVIYVLPIFIPDSHWDFYDPEFGHLRNAAPFTDGEFIPFGVDEYGRSTFATIVEGGAISLQLGLIIIVISTTLGVTFGAIAGFYGGRVDNFIMRSCEIIGSIPLLPLMISVTSSMSASGIEIEPDVRMYAMMTFMGLLGWTGLARMLRGQILAVREEEYITASKLLGIKERNIMFKHIVPNVVGIIIVSVTLGLGGAIMAESGLSYLGFGLSQSEPSWGNLLNRGLKNLDGRFYYQWLLPGLTLLITVLGVNFVGDGLRDALDPKNSGR